MANAYHAQNQWGGSAAPWHDGGNWSLGCRGTQHVVDLNVASTDGGHSLTGTMTYAGEGPIGFKAHHTGGCNYTVENQWGGNAAPWHPGGNWVIGCRPTQSVISVHATSHDGGKSFDGTMTYAGEGPIGLKLNLH